MSDLAIGRAAHGWVTSIALAMSGRPQPYTREMMLQQWQARRAAAVR